MKIQIVFLLILVSLIQSQISQASSQLNQSNLKLYFQKSIVGKIPIFASENLLILFAYIGFVISAFTLLYFVSYLIYHFSKTEDKKNESSISTNYNTLNDVNKSFNMKKNLNLSVLSGKSNDSTRFFSQYDDTTDLFYKENSISPRDFRASNPLTPRSDGNNDDLKGYHDLRVDENEVLIV